MTGHERRWRDTKTDLNVNVGGERNGGRGDGGEMQGTDVSGAGSGRKGAVNG